MTNTPYDFDYFVIGAGSGGVRSSRIAASLGAKVGIAEYKDIGGTCVNVGCVPKKIMAYAADYHGHFEDALGYGWDINIPKRLDWQKFISRKNAEIKRLNGIYDGILEKAGVTYFEGHASLLDPHTIQIHDHKITADKILIATGGTPRKDMIPGCEHTLTSDEIFYLEHQPESILIVGGGYVSVEFAHIFHGMGSNVTLCYRGDCFLKDFDDDMRATLKNEMEIQGVNLRFKCDLASVEKLENGKLRAHFSNGEPQEFDCILSAIGRLPNTQGLGLQDLGIDLHKNGQIKVNENYQTSIPNIYAIGDVSNRHNLTPVATAEGQSLAHYLFGQKNSAQISYENIATAIFSHPPIATVGYSEKDARDKGLEIEVFKAQFRSMKYILAERNEKIMMKLVVCKKTDKVLGVHMIGLDAPEIMQGFAVALNAGATKADFDRTIGIHPTSAEEFVTMK
jgi:glutathione reductase (NADPH)